ncbi:MAG: MarR family transcriptional regulator [Proteobacteria bacterium]|jgi:Transcriptional regulators|nr:MAG: MarR family transcriptional regulator [Pseudomonadota bacterium]
MSKRNELPFEITLLVRDSCLCLHVQRAARAVARRYDEILRPVGLTNGQFSLLMSLNRPQPPTMGEVSSVLAMDRTTLTANLKPLERRGLVAIKIDEADRRSRRLQLTEAGRELLRKALPLWEKGQAANKSLIPSKDFNRLLAELRALSEL